MNRYTGTQIIREPITGKRRIETTIYNKLQVSASDIFIRTTGIERLDKLALDFYGDSTAWPLIANANGLGKGTYVIPPNTRLRIPVVDNVNQFTNINSTR
jgi:hypothetical protein